MSAAFEAKYIERAAVDEHIAFEQGVMIMLGLEADEAEVECVGIDARFT